MPRTAPRPTSPTIRRPTPIWGSAASARNASSERVAFRRERAEAGMQIPASFLLHQPLLRERRDDVPASPRQAEREPPVHFPLLAGCQVGGAAKATKGLAWTDIMAVRGSCPTA